MTARIRWKLAPLALINGSAATSLVVTRRNYRVTIADGHQRAHQTSGMTSWRSANVYPQRRRRRAGARNFSVTTIPRLRLTQLFSCQCLPTCRPSEPHTQSQVTEPMYHKIKHRRRRCRLCRARVGGHHGLIKSQVRRH